MRVRHHWISQSNVPLLGFSLASSLLKSGDVSLRFRVRFPAWESKSLCFRPLLDSSLAPVSRIGLNNAGAATLFSERLLPLTTSGGGDWGEEGPHGLGGDLQFKVSLCWVRFRRGSILAKSVHQKITLATFRLEYYVQQQSISGGVRFPVQFSIEYFALTWNNFPLKNL